MRLLLDEMYPAEIAVALRDAGHDVIAVQEDPALRGREDAAIFDLAQAQERAIVTEDAHDFIELDAQAHSEGRAHHGLVFTTNRAFPRHHRRFVSAVVRSLRSFLDEHPDDDTSSGIWWLEPPG